MSIFGLKPAWTTDPKVEDIRLLALKDLEIDCHGVCDVTFFVQGALNQLFPYQDQY
jgi:hypothetical protein